MNKANHELELELTFLAKSIPKELLSGGYKELVDVYIPGTGVEHPRLRLRKKGESYQITKKTQISEGDASAHNEVTIELEKDEYDAIANCSDKRVIKNRYSTIIDGYAAEIDIFQGDLKGLALIDFEFSSKEDMNSFRKPSVCANDVTQEDFIAGGRLAGKSISDIKEDLTRLEYKVVKA